MEELFSDTTKITQTLLILFSAIGLLSAVAVVLSKRPITSAFCLVLVFFNVAAVYALLSAHFIAAIQLLVYAGAVMVLFVFVVLLLNADVKTVDLNRKKLFQVGAIGLVLGLFGTFFYFISKGEVASIRSGFTPEKIEKLGGNAKTLSELMFSDFILPFEMTSILLLVGIVGSVALAKRNVK
ncbi:MAG: NADH-quinone oxidoreductase subunit J [Bacteriovoracia bacterium]